LTAWVASVGALPFESGVRSSAANDPHHHHPAAFNAVSARLPLGTVSFEREPDQRLIWLAPEVVNRLRALRGPGESCSDVNLQLVEFEAKGEF
jgi:hypothetical protein